jgi:hypothetical protein
MAKLISLYIITFNEVQNLCEVPPTILCTGEDVVVDSFSTDGTMTSFDTCTGNRHLCHRLCHLYNLLIYRQPGRVRPHP